MNGLPTNIFVTPLGPGKYVILMSISKANLSGLKNPSAVEIVLGSNFGSTTTNTFVLIK
jgi:hypothetical protein